MIASGDEMSDATTGGHRELPESFKEITGYTDFDTEGLLFNMVDDAEQRVNLYEAYPERINELDNLLQEYRNSSSSVKK